MKVNELFEAVHRVPKGTNEKKPWAPSEGRDRDDPQWDWKNPNDNPSGKKPVGELPHKVDGKYDKTKYPIVFDDAEDSIHLYDPSLIKHIKKDVGVSEWNNMSEYEQIKAQLQWAMPPPTKGMREWSAKQWETMWDRETKALQKQIKRS